MKNNITFCPIPTRLSPGSTWKKDKILDPFSIELSAHEKWKRVETIKFNDAFSLFKGVYPILNQLFFYL